MRKFYDAEATSGGYSANDKMITAEEINFEEGKRKLPGGIYPGMAYDKQINAMKSYAKEAIKADRLNLLNYIKLKGLYHKSLDEDSILNAPMIELL